MTSNTTVIIVEDDPDLNEYLHELLSEHFIVHNVTRGSQALKLIKQTKPDLVVLDLMLPDMQGEDLCTQIKDVYPQVPIIILTAKDDPRDIVKNLNQGADDYLTKPFSSEELLARIRARLRSDNRKQTSLKIADLELDTNTLEVARSGKIIPLTHTEFQLLHYLLANKNHVLTREMILSHVWSYTPDIQSRVVDVYVGYLRKKIDNGHSNKLIHSVRGFGYTVKDKTLQS